jgi:hypothetical protein
MAALNRQWLQLVREAARLCVVSTTERFGVSLRFAERIGAASLEDINALANSPAFVMGPLNSQALDLAMGMIQSGTAEQHPDLLATTMLLASNDARRFG